MQLNNLKVGDILETSVGERKVLLVLESMVVLSLADSFKNASGLYTLEEIEQEGWQLKKIEEKNPCYIFNGVTCQECTKEKTENKIIQDYSNEIREEFYKIFRVGTSFGSEHNKYITNFISQKIAEAYRSELIERNK